MKRLIAMLLAALGLANTGVAAAASGDFGCSAWLTYWDADAALMETAAFPEGFVEQGIDSLSEMTEGVVGQPAIPHLNLSGVPVVVPHVVIQAADDFRSHVLQEDVRPSNSVKILLYSFADSLLVLHRRFSVVASGGIADIKKRKK